MGGNHEKAHPKEAVTTEDPAWKKFRLPSRYFDDSASPAADTEGSLSECTPIIAFVNAGSGGHVGETLSGLLAGALGEHQVYNVGKGCNPERVLKKLWDNFEMAERRGEKGAAEYRSRLRLLAGGGDGTIAWVLNSVRKLDLRPCPPAAVIPLGTGNGLSINFGWGKTIRPNWIMSNKKLLEELNGVANAEERAIDIWHVNYEAPRPSFFNKDDIPAALSVSSGTTPADARPAPPEAPGHDEAGARMAGEFCYYFTFGLDAEAAHRFDRLRASQPLLTKKRKMNIFWYMWFVIRTGWFCGASPLNEKIAKLQIKDKDGKWIDVEVANSIRALIIINLQTYSGGRDVWGLKDERREFGADKGFVPPIFDDGLLEVVGLEGGFTSWAALSGISKHLHGRRIAQANEIRITYHSPKEKKGVAMRMDGEPWWQDLPDREGEDLKVMLHPPGRLTLMTDYARRSIRHQYEAIPGAPTASDCRRACLQLDITHKGQAKMLLNTACLPGVTKKLLTIAEREKKLSKPSNRE